MGFFKPSYVICFLILVTLGLTYLFSQLFLEVFSYMQDNGEQNLRNSWLFRLLLNLLGYATIFVPGIILYVYVKKSNLSEKSDLNYWNSLLKKCFIGAEKKGYINVDAINTATGARTFFQDAVHLSFCSTGLLVAYLLWGILQEKIMTQRYMNAEGQVGTFKNSQFLVFTNRILAFVFSLFAIFILNQPRHTVPYYKYIYCSFSNIMSSWCQYEALKFISFPTQVLSKACKLIPVMLMGKVVSKRKYEYYEYVTALLICIGMVLFLGGSSDVTTNDQVVTTFSGVVLIIGYLVFDSFTSNWQSELFTQYTASSLQMMCGVNFFSCLLTSVSLLQQEGFYESLRFSFQFPHFAIDCVLLSICSAVGQLFVYYTISCFGPVVFIIIMTFRQALAIILSCIIYSHFISSIGIMGIIIVFFAIFLRIYCSHRLKILRKKAQNSSSSV